jgi:hypothetical protein
VVVLHEIRINPELGEGFLVPALEKKPARVTKDSGS